MTPHNLDLIFTLTGALVAALAFGLLTHRIGLSPIIGYMVAGVFLGRHAAGYVANYDIASELAEIGVILLMFGVGLQFNLKELLAVRAVAIPGALVQIALATVLGAVTAHGFGWDWGAGILFGLSISVASTVVLTRILSDNNALHTQTGHIAIGWLVVEDVFTVLVLVLVPALAGKGGQGAGNALLSIGGAIGKISLLIAITFFFGRRWLPQFLGWVAATRSRELFTLSVLAVALGIGVSSATLFGASMALGAFLAGMIVNQSAYSHRAAIEALPMRDAFAVLFFVSVGMLFDPWNFNQEWWMIGLTCLVILVGKPIAGFACGPHAQLSPPRGPLRGDRFVPDRRIFLHPRNVGKRTEDSAGNSGRRARGLLDDFDHAKSGSLPFGQANSEDHRSESISALVARPGCIGFSD